MKLYEALIIFPGQLPGDSTQQAKTLFEELVKKHQGKIVSHTELGKKFLGYTVKKQKEANLISFVFELAPDKMDAFRRALQLSEEVLKFTIVSWKKPAEPRSPRRSPVEQGMGTERRHSSWRQA